MGFSVLLRAVAAGAPDRRTYEAASNALRNPRNWPNQESVAPVYIA